MATTVYLIFSILASISKESSTQLLEIPNTRNHINYYHLIAHSLYFETKYPNGSTSGPCSKLISLLVIHLSQAFIYIPISIVVLVLLLFSAKMLMIHSTDTISRRIRCFLTTQAFHLCD